MFHRIAQAIKLAQTVTDATFNPRPAFLNLVEVWRIRGQVEHLTARLLNQLFDLPSFVEGGIVNDQPLSWFEGVNQAGFNPSFKDDSITRPFDRKGGDQLVVTIGCNHIDASVA